jgi:hypothetical protein
MHSYAQLLKAKMHYSLVIIAIYICKLETHCFYKAQDLERPTRMHFFASFHRKKRIVQKGPRKLDH